MEQPACVDRQAVARSGVGMSTVSIRSPSLSSSRSLIVPSVLSARWATREVSTVSSPPSAGGRLVMRAGSQTPLR